MPWRPLESIAFAVATYPFQPTSPAELPLELGDELYIFEQGGKDLSWCRGYLVSPPSLLAGLTSTKGQPLEARIFSGIFPRNCVEIREVLGDRDKDVQDAQSSARTSEVRARRSAEIPNGLPISVSDGSEKENVDPNALIGSRQNLDPNVKPKINGFSSPEKIKQKSSRRVSQQSLLSSVPHTPLGVRSPQILKPAAPVPMLKIGDETPTSASEPLVDEIASCLREWHSTNLHELLLARQYSTLERLSKIVAQLDLARRQLLQDVLTAQERAAVREQAVWNLVKGNRMLKGDVIVRSSKDRGRLLTAEDSVIDVAVLQTNMSVLDAKPVPQQEVNALYHLLFEARAFRGSRTGPVNLSVAICLKSEDGVFSPLTENFTLDLLSQENFLESLKTGKLRTLFTELSLNDVGEKDSPTNGTPYLVIRLHNTQPLKMSPPSKIRSPSSRDATVSSKMPGFLNNAGTGSLRRGRGSLMFGGRSKSAPGPESLKPPADNRFEQTSGQKAMGTGNTEGPPKTPVSRKGSAIRLDAVGVLDLTQIIRQTKESDHTVTLWSAADANREDSEHTETFDPAVESILYSASGKYAPCQHTSHILLHLSAFLAPHADALIKQNPTLMHNICETKKIGFSKAPSSVRSDIYVTLSEAVLPHDTTLSHPEHGFVPINSPASLLNLQVTIEVRDFSGKRIEHCIFPSSNSTGLTAWRTVVTESGSQWDQTICLKIPPQQVPGSHLIMSVADYPDFPFALSWMPLWDQHAFIHDGHHALMLHAYDKTTSGIVNGKGAYLSLPWKVPQKRPISQEHDVTPPLAKLILETYLCSTEYSHDPTILGLINWKNQPQSQLIEMLRKVVFIPEIEIVKQLRDVFDALFAILVNKAGEAEFEDVIFNDLVTVLGIVHDRRFNLAPIVDDYVETHFQYPFATPCLLRSYGRLLNNPAEVESSRKLRATFKVGRHILKFILNARGQQKSKEEEIGITKSNFKKDMLSIVNALQLLMRDRTPILIGSQTILVQHFHAWLPELCTTFTKDEVIQIAFQFMESCADVKSKLILYKLILIRHYAELDLWYDSNSNQNQLIANCCKWLAPYWGQTDKFSEQWRQQIRLCASVVSELCKFQSSSLFGFLPKTVESYSIVVAQGVSEKDSLSLMFPSALPFPSRPAAIREKFDEALLELSALMAAICKMPQPSEYPVPEGGLTDYILAFLNAHKSVLNAIAYPKNWLTLHVYHHVSTMYALEYLSTILTRSYLPAPDLAEQFDMEIWRSFFETLLLLVSSSSLALETFPEQRRRAVWKIAGDVRNTGAQLMWKTWNAIGWETEGENERYGIERMGGYQVQYVPSLVGPVVELCLSVHEGLRQTAVGILQTMIIGEWELNEDLAMIEAEMVVSLDKVFKTQVLNESITQKLFIGELLDLFEPIAAVPDDPLWAALKELIAVVDELMDLLVAAHDGSMTENIHTLRLLDFMKGMNKAEIYIRYVHEMAEMQEKPYPTEAGLALQFHADLYEWDVQKKLPAIEAFGFPEQSAFERKEALYFRMINYFEDGKAWSQALITYRELAHHYEHTVFDYYKLSRTLKAMGKIMETITHDESRVPRYFRVVYQGLGFPAALRDKQFIFEAGSNERMATFSDRMLKLHPGAQVVQSDDMENMEGQYLLVSSVSPHRTLDHPVHQKTRVPPSLRDHLLVANPHQFSITSKRQVPGVNVKEQTVEKTIFETSESFPTVLRRSEIVAVDEVELSPLQTAVERTWRKTSDLLAQEKRALVGEDANSSALTETLGQLLDIENPTGTCLAHYRQFLLDPEDQTQVNGDIYHDENEDTSLKPPPDPLQSALQVALSDHAFTIKRCLDSSYVRPSLLATRRDLLSRLERVYPDALTPDPPSTTIDDMLPDRALSPDNVLSPSNLNPKISIDNTSRPPNAPLSPNNSATPVNKSSRLSLNNFLRGSILPERKTSNKNKNTPPATLPNGSSTNGDSTIAEEVPTPRPSDVRDLDRDQERTVDRHPQAPPSRDGGTSTPGRLSRSASRRSRSRKRGGSRTNPSIHTSDSHEYDYDHNTLRSKHSLDHGSVSVSVVTSGPGATLRAPSRDGVAFSQTGSAWTAGSGTGVASERPDTAESRGAESGTGRDKERGVKKRFSLLGLGKKRSGWNVKVEGVAEE
ncbi:MAG: hypothetical protein Q9227_002562 [Pyrenula ochraceoflavens]